MLLPIELAPLLLAALISFAHAQTSTVCNPLKETCPDALAIPATFQTNFAISKGIPAGWHSVPCKGPLTYGSDGATFQIKDALDCPTIETDGAVLFGLFEVKVKAAPGQGIVSSIVMQSDDLDEVDWEFIGGEDYRVQSNYFGKGDSSTYDRMVYIPVPSVHTTVHTYSVNWTAQALTWMVDGKAVRTLNYKDAKDGTRYPQTPLRLRIGIWAGGDPTNSDGTITWAGGKVDYSKGPFNMVAESVSIINYSPGEKYHYGDQSGSWQSIQVIGGSTGGIGNPGRVLAGASSSVRSSTSGESTPSVIVPVQSIPAVTHASASTASATAISSGVGPVKATISSTLPDSTAKPASGNSTVTKASVTTSKVPAATANAASGLGMTAGLTGFGLSAFFIVLFF